MRLPTYRRLNLGLAISSLGMFGASIQPWLSNGAVAYASGGYPWLVPQALRLWSAGAFAFTSLLCVSTWAKSVESRGIFTRPARGAVGSLWALVPFPRQGGTLDDPEKVHNSSRLFSLSRGKGCGAVGLVSIRPQQSKYVGLGVSMGTRILFSSL